VATRFRLAVNGWPQAVSPAPRTVTEAVGPVYRMTIFLLIEPHGRNVVPPA